MVFLGPRVRLIERKQCRGTTTYLRQRRLSITQLTLLLFEIRPVRRRLRRIVVTRFGRVFSVSPRKRRKPPKTRGVTCVWTRVGGSRTPSIISANRFPRAELSTDKNYYSARVRTPAYVRASHGYTSVAVHTCTGVRNLYNCRRPDALKALLETFTVYASCACARVF